VVPVRNVLRSLVNYASTLSLKTQIEDEDDDDEYENEIRQPRSKPADAAKSALKEDTLAQEAFS
jgi:hypothetical protein